MDRMEKVFRARRKEIGRFQVHDYPDNVMKQDWIGYVDGIYNFESEAHYGVVYAELDAYYLFKEHEGEFIPFDPEGKNVLQRTVALLNEEDAYYAAQKLDNEDADPVV